MKVVLVIPCYNEESLLEMNINKVLSVVDDLNCDIRIVISDNSSVDKTAEIGKRLAEKNKNVDYFFVGTKGKGAAVIEAWQAYDVDLYGFMDIDLSVGLESIAESFKYLDSGFDIVIASRRVKGAEVEREMKRKIISAILNMFIRFIFLINIKDTPCGFKFFNKKTISEILPKVKNRAWVFDTEILVLASKAGYKIKEMPVVWKEIRETESRVNVYPTAKEYILELLRIKRSL